MVKHIVFWKLKEEVNGKSKTETALLIKEQLEALNGQIEGLIKVEVGINFLESPSNYDVALFAELESKDALTYYASHPKHVEAGALVKEAASDRKAVDFEV
ncbi:Dabb family protein [Dysgonomonas sp. 216]|uniref:Dabb family protein n=1 Tax=Dysgonomonas sp. 216 TaxID=2302934 RepID=UPI0013D1DF8D|nr:Dabb family protein [Dysgonomonas sp. 216]NDW18356.1 Dabb family protein [Dysgonomonas sp. 216]NDW18724.1 Dabb family protein [Dysgonomonas sp. 216]